MPWLIIASLALPAAAQKKKDEEPETQVLELPKDLPGAVVAEAGRLVFRTTPLSSKGLLSQQVRDGLKWLQRQDKASVVKLRAFVAGSGDVRRIAAIVSEEYTEKKLPLPALTVLRVGALPRPGAQVVLEATSIEPKRIPNPDGLAFIGGIEGRSDQPLAPLRPLAETAFGRLRAALSESGVEPADLLRATCFLTSLDGLDYIRQRAFADYPGTQWNFLQSVREPGASEIACEAVARLRKPPGEKPQVSGGLARIGAGKIVLSGGQLAFGFEEADARLAFERLGKTLEQAGAGLGDVFFMHAFTLSPAMSERVRKVVGGLDKPVTAAIQTQTVEALASIDASFCIDATAVYTQPK